MRKALVALGMLLMTTTAANAGGLVTKHASSVQLTVDAARSTSTRIGSTFSISGSNIDTTDGTTAGTVSAGTITSGVYNPGTIAATQDTAGAAFSFSQSYTQADTVITNCGSCGCCSQLLKRYFIRSRSKGYTCWYCNQCWCSYGNCSGAGTSATGQFVSEITVID